MGEKVSIIVPVYNCEKYLEKCVKSLVNQSYQNIEIILVDDGSTDNSKNVCFTLKEKYPDKIVVLSKKNGGPSSARNMGIDVSSGKYITFVDSDDWLDNDAIEKMVKAIKPGVLAKINYYTVRNDNNVLNNKFTNSMAKKEYFEKILKGILPGSIWASLYEKETIGSLRFDEKTYYLEDFLFLTEYLKHVKEIIFVDSYYYYCIDNSNSITTSKNKIMNNIKSFNYSLDRINSISNNEFNKLISSKSMILIEKEIAKIDSKNSLKEILNNECFINIINEIDTSSLSKLYKILLRLYKKKNIELLWNYIKIRALAKRIKVRLRG